MPGFKQSSILFTLQSLKKLELERAAKRTGPDRLLHQVESTRIARERRRQQESQREREERARIEAMKQAEIARALADGEARARLELLARQQQHRQRLADLDAEARVRRQRLVGRLAFLVTLAGMAGALGVYVLKVRPETERIQSAYDRLVAAERKRADDVEQLLSREQERRQRLARRLEQAETEIAALKKKTASRRGR
jgi:colicin import membrane protein